MAMKSSLSQLSLTQLQAEINKRQRKLPTLNKKYKKALRVLAKAERAVAKFERQMSALGAAGGRRGGATGGRRARGGLSLVASLQAALKGKTLGVSEAVDAIRAGGYQSVSPNLRVMVNQALVASKNKKLFKRVSRGVYTAA